MQGRWCPGPGWAAACFRVRYAETDAAGVVHHASYLWWFEEGRSELSRCIGLPYRDLERTGVDLVVAVVEARYMKAARYDEAVEVWARLLEVRSRACAFEYRIVRAEDGEPLVRGVTRHVAVARATGQPTRIPEPFFSGYRDAARSTGDG